MFNECPVCNLNLIPDKGQYPPKTGDRQYFDCLRCGNFVLSRSLVVGLQDILKNDDEKKDVLSHSIRKMQRSTQWPYIDSYLIDSILKNTLPTPFEQIDNFVSWLGEKTSSGESKRIDKVAHQALIGAKDVRGVDFIIKHLHQTGIVDGSVKEANGDIIIADVFLTMRGWIYFNEIKKGLVASRKAFMAMKFGDADLDQMLNQYFKPAVAATGFELYKLDEAPRAGLIDDRLRVEIRTSRFLISDLTHENAGAYWEAGYAEGLGKPVIYTCEKSKFEKQKTHFDTNHHLTVVWDKDQPELAVEQLKAIIRATLPDEAKLTDA